MTSSIARAARPALMAAAIVCFAGSMAFAHHSFAAFDMTAQKSVTGTVKKVDWTNPHIWVWLDVQEGAATTTYAFEGMSPNFLERRGWTRQTLQPGAKLTVEFRPMRNGKPGGMFINGKLPNGTVLTMLGADEPTQ